MQKALISFGFDRSRRSILVGLAFLAIGAVIGSLLGAAVGYFTTHQWFYAEGKADWASVWTMRWTAALAILALLSFASAIGAVWYAKQSVDTVRETERIKRTEELVRRFEDGLDRLFSLYVYPDVGTLAQKSQRVESEIGRDVTTRDAIRNLLNYLSWVAGLSARSLIDDELFFDRLGMNVIVIYCVLGFLIDHFKAQRIGDNPTMAQFIQRAYQSFDEASRPAILDQVTMDEEGNVTLK